MTEGAGFIPDSAKLPLTEAQIVELTQRIDFSKVRERIGLAQERYDRHKRPSRRKFRIDF